VQDETEEVKYKNIEEGSTDPPSSASLQIPQIPKEIKSKKG